LARENLELSDLKSLSLLQSPCEGFMDVFSSGERRGDGFQSYCSLTRLENSKTHTEVGTAMAVAILTRFIQTAKFEFKTSDKRCVMSLPMII
jgi:hypothetical protein